jgi:Putative restriction endonuclease
VAVVDVYAELPELLRPLRRAEYDQLVDQGAFDDEKIELIEGVLVEMSPEGTDHAWVIQQLNKVLTRALPEHLALRVTARGRRASGPSQSPTSPWSRPPTTGVTTLLPRGS